VLSEHVLALQDGALDAPSKVVAESAPLQPASRNEGRLRAQRVFDIAVAVTALLMALPFLLIVAACIRLQDGGPALFQQVRIGRGGKPFACIKFRTMTIDAQAHLDALLAFDAKARKEWARDRKLRGDPRITRLGRILRETSLDEMPQFINVLRGEMSVVGPRPIVAAEASRYGRSFRHYCAVRPGITGLWQVSGRSDTSYRRRVALDVLYARAPSLRRDCEILLLTIPAVFMRKGSY
jgi:exopolysaccharide production protein ExoY